jgi:arsenate reductase
MDAGRGWCVPTLVAPSPGPRIRRRTIARVSVCVASCSRHGKGRGMTLTLYGICNCDTVKKARAWLDAAGIGYDFHDYKTQGVDRARLEGWVARLGWEVVLNRAGTTFRKLPDADKAGLDAERAVAGRRGRRNAARRVQAGGVGDGVGVASGPLSPPAGERRGGDQPAVTPLGMALDRASTAR